MKIFLKGKTIFEFKNTIDKKSIMDFLKVNGFYSKELTDGNLMIIPSLRGYTFIFQTLNFFEELEGFVKELREELNKIGSTAIIVKKKQINSEMFKVLKAKIVLNFIQRKDEPSPDISFYYSMANKEQSQDLIGKILRQITEHNNITYEVSSKLKHYIKVNYLKTLNEPDTPSILMEIKNNKILTDLKELMIFIIINSLAEIYVEGYPEKIRATIKALEKFKQDKPNDELQLKQNSSELHKNELRKTLPKKNTLQQQKIKSKTSKKRKGILNPLNPPYDGKVITFKRPEINASNHTFNEIPYTIGPKPIRNKKTRRSSKGKWLYKSIQKIGLQKAA